MKIKKYSYEITEFDSYDELAPDDQFLLEKAMAATANAYAPYSRYFVGAALRLENGMIITGNNQENVAYPSGLCAERVALFHAKANYPGEAIEVIAITAKSADFIIDNPVTPCGACRQVMAEIENHQKKKIRIIMHGDNGRIFIAENVETLLPLMFQADGLKKNNNL